MKLSLISHASLASKIGKEMKRGRLFQFNSKPFDEKSQHLRFIKMTQACQGPRLMRDGVINGPLVGVLSGSPDGPCTFSQARPNLNDHKVLLLSCEPVCLILLKSPFPSQLNIQGSSKEKWSFLPPFLLLLPSTLLSLCLRLSTVWTVWKSLRPGKRKTEKQTDRQTETSAKLQSEFQISFFSFSKLCRFIPLFFWAFVLHAKPLHSLPPSVWRSRWRLPDSQVETQLSHSPHNHRQTGSTWNRHFGFKLQC